MPNQHDEYRRSCTICRKGAVVKDVKTQNVVFNGIKTVSDYDKHHFNSKGINAAKRFVRKSDDRSFTIKK